MEDAPFLLTMPEYNGTLAAARCLGQHGIRVTMAGNQLTAPARWSRHVSRWLQAPKVTEPERFLEWLLEFGAREPGHVLYPTSDDLTWLFAQNADLLSRHYRLFQPDVSTILRLLDKKALHETCTKLGIATLPTRFPDDEGDAERIAGELGFPLLLKPRTQIFLSTRSKGSLVPSREQFTSYYRTYVKNNWFNPLFARAVPGIERPLLQAYQPHAADGIYSLAGFVAPGGETIVARAAMKIFQRPKRLGVGLCFEERPVNRQLMAHVAELCREVGYFGVFEAEFIPDGDRFDLLDFNPRFYGQMGFEVGRDLPLAYLAWLGALGKKEALSSALAGAAEWQEGRGFIYCHGFYLNMLIALRRASGRMAPDEAERWQQWLKTRKRQSLAVDAADVEGDRMPGLMSAAHEVYVALRHPRSFLLAHVLDP